MSSRGRIFATIQARMTSSRLPGKVLAPAVGKPMLELMIERLKRVPSLEGIILATTTNATDDPVAALADRLSIKCYRGDENNVLSRVLEAAETFGAEVIVQTTGDCPLIDPETVERIIGEYLRTGLDHVSNVVVRSFPIGMDTQVFETRILRDVRQRTNDPAALEHVSLYIYQHPEVYSLGHVEASGECRDPQLRLTLDTPEDYDLISRIFEALYPSKPDFGLNDIMMFLKKNPALRNINGGIEHRWAFKNGAA